MSRRFEELIIQSEGESPKRCKFCRSPEIRHRKPSEVIQETLETQTIYDVFNLNTIKWIQCSRCKALWIEEI